MVERIRVEVVRDSEAMRGSLVRYDFLERLASTAQKCGVTVLAFGLGAREWRLLLEGAHDEVSNVIRGLKVGTQRSLKQWGFRLRFSSAERFDEPAADLSEAVAWCHCAPVDAGALVPLASPWSSHRDLLGFRFAGFYDARVLEGRCDARDVHARCGGTPLPPGWPPRSGERESLSLLLRVAASILGVLPADRRCFGLFAHLARLRGWTNAAIAKALAVCTRRVRQILAAAAGVPVTVAVRALASPALVCVP
jgi:hypothetical protein